MDQAVAAVLRYSAGMTIRRIMPNVITQDIEESRSFYSDFLGMDVRMDEPGFLMLASPGNPTAQMTLVSLPQTHGTHIPPIRHWRSKSRTLTPRTPQPSARGTRWSIP